MPNEPQDNLWWKFVNLDPAVFRGLVMAIVMLLGTVGILVSPELADGLIGAWVALMAVVQALWTRRGVTPNARVAVVVPDPVNAPDVVMAGEAATDAPADEIVEAARVLGS